MSELNLRMRRAVTSQLIRLGPDNRLVIALLNTQCKRFGAVLTRGNSHLLLQKGQCRMLLSKKHFVYAPVLAERFDDYFNDLVPTEIDGLKVLDYSKAGVVQTYSRSGLQFEMSSFPEELSAIDDYFHWYTPKHGDLVFDIGAHCGVSTFHFAKLVGAQGRVIAFEPDPVNYSLLLHNLERHKLSNVEAHQIAISRSCGREPFSSEESIGSTLMSHSSRASVGNVVMVETKTLENAFETWGSPHLCKIDIEGAEIAVMESAVPFLKMQRPQTNFAMDTNHLVGGTFTSGHIESLFRTSGFEAETSRVGFRTTWARPADEVQQNGK